jgi:hypothetical protein
MPKKFSTWYSSRSPADERDGAKRKVVPLSNVGNSGAPNNRLASASGANKKYTVRLGERKVVGQSS